MSTYPHHDQYWVAPKQAPSYPWRHGDIFQTPDIAACRSSAGPWCSVIVLHPSCELNAKSRPNSLVTVARVRPVSDVGDENQRALIRAGWTERGGAITVAFAHTFWIPPAPEDEDQNRDSYVDFREVVAVQYKELSNRLAALTHDARVHLIARELYFRYRWKVPTEEVRASEAIRIAADPAFNGPRPGWS